MVKIWGGGGRGENIGVCGENLEKYICYGRIIPYGIRLHTAEIILCTAIGYMAVRNTVVGYTSLEYKAVGCTAVGYIAVGNTAG